MTNNQSKELELFKRWFGVELEESNTRNDIQITDCGKVIVPTYCIPDERGLFVNKKYIKQFKFDSDYFLGFFFRHMLVTTLTLIYEVPSQYHSEWEQYVKDKA